MTVGPAGRLSLLEGGEWQRDGYERWCGGATTIMVKSSTLLGCDGSLTIWDGYSLCSHLGGLCSLSCCAVVFLCRVSAAFVVKLVL